MERLDGVSIEVINVILPELLQFPTSARRFEYPSIFSQYPQRSLVAMANSELPKRTR